ncbi:MAG: ADP-ribose pyrophosphatase [Firmicutes bacterium HGW-Firmicutes-12]|jgi:ADP-ribose pyrophosphatase YjhB (NUDIX family)|nr:MAG: ADP-ribose pyrophosphatase [Firmicutes bacterium HGW-Firmicutes-12]
MTTNIKQRFFFCPKCGGKLEYKKHNDRFRPTCTSCSYIIYENPIVGVAAIIYNHKGHILLGRRKGGKYQGMWCIPCGYLEYDEDVYVGVIREIKEETNLDIEPTSVFTVQSNFHEPECHTVGIWFLSQIKGGKLEAGDDLLDVAYFDLLSYPTMAFPTDIKVIELLLNSNSKR